MHINKLQAIYFAYFHF